MKTLILYASAGSGHKKAAEAVYFQLKNQYPNAEILFVDAVNFATPFYRFSYTVLYEFLIAHLRFIWAMLFFLSNKPILYIFNKQLRFFIDRKNLRKLSVYITDLQPNVIVSTHFTCSELAIYLKSKNKIKSKIISIVTDFGAHYFWAKNGADKYIVATEGTRQELIRFGIDEERIKILGIPINDKFFEEIDKASLKKKYFGDAKFTALIMTGTIAIGPIDKIVENLYKEINLIVICGNNKILFDKLSRKNYPSLKVLGLVDNVYEWMSACDILITKAGGLSVTEAIAKLLPMIFFFVIPGQEKNNALFIQRCAAGRIIKNISRLSEFILNLRDKPYLLAQMIQHLKRLKKDIHINIAEEIMSIIDEEKYS